MRRTALRKTFFFLLVLLIFAWIIVITGVYRDMENDSELGNMLYLIDVKFRGNLVTRVDTGGDKLVALTFDDGPDPRFTPQILAILEKYDVPATFFVVGKFAEKYPDIVEAEIAGGHEVENHTYTHPNLKKDTFLKDKDEIKNCGEVIKKLTGRQPHFFRPPKRLYNKDTLVAASELGYKTVLWTIGIEHHRAKTPEKEAERVIKAARNGMIILGHDGRLNRIKTVEALPIIIKAYKDMGYRFVTTEELFMEIK